MKNMRKVVFKCAGACMLLGAAAAGPPAAAAPVVLQPHVAVYDLKMTEARPGSGIEDVSGRLVLELSQDCEGYITNQRFITRLTNKDGADVVVDYSISSWESLDGLRYRFNLAQDVNGRAVERFEGSAVLQGSGGGGEAVYTEPEEKVTPLPDGTQFPTQHVVLILEALQQQQPTANVKVFDGSGDTGLYDTFAIFGKPRSHDDSLSADLGLAGVTARPVRISFFPLVQGQGEAAQVPDVEVGFDLYDDGIADRVDFNYGDFRLGGRLQSLDLTETINCD